MESSFEHSGRQRLYGTYPALVVGVDDSRDRGRVEVELPWVGEEEGRTATAWARLATMMAGDGRGTYFVPDVGDEVLINFMAGDPSHPVVIGALWNGEDDPPESMDAAGSNDVRSITSRSDHRVRFVDEGASGRLEVESGGGHELVLDDGDGTITLRHANGATIEIDASGTVSVEALSRVEIDAPAGVDVTSAKLEVTAPISRFSGVVKADTVITNSVVSSSYTPGAGNVW